ncbi:MAG: hypothetical protein ACRDCH_01935, partial [Metamycoplasmataceae bacterium]
ETLYNGWKTSGLEQPLKEQIKELITSTPEAINNVDLTLTENFPSKGREPIPGGTITFNLNPGYINISGVYTITIDSLGIAKNKNITIKPDAKTEITKKLAGLIGNVAGYDEQKTLYDDWKANRLEPQLKDQIKALITSTPEAINNVTLAMGNFPNSPGGTIPGGTITFDLNPGYNNISGVYTITIDSLGIAKNINITIKSDAKEEITKKLTGLINSKSSYDEQKKLYDDWKANRLEPQLKDQIKELITSTPGAIDNINLNLGEFPPKGGFLISGGTITFDLNPGYDVDGVISPIDIGTLGTAKSKLISINSNSSKNEISTMLAGMLNSEPDYNSQKTIYESWDNSNTNIINLIEEKIKFIGGTYSDAIRNIEIEKSSFPSGSNIDIPPITIKVFLSAGYTFGFTDNDVIIITNLGKTK